MHKKTMQILSLSVASLFVASVAMANHNASGGGGGLGIHQNDIDIDQVGMGNDSNTTQDGLDNIMDFDQTDLNGDNRIDAIQTGNNNVSKMTQDGVHDTGVGNEIDLVQTGNDNIANVDQDAPNTAGSGGTTGNNTVDVTQTGNGNKLVGAGVALGVVTRGNDTSNATQTTANGDNTLISVQTGNTNEAGLYQQAGAGNTANIVQSGVDKLASYQISADTTDVFSNDLDVDQLGTSINVAVNYQVGNSSHSYKLCQSSASNCPTP